MTTDGLLAAQFFHNAMYYSLYISCCVAFLFCISLFFKEKKKPQRKLLILDMNNLLVCRAFKFKMKEEFPSYIPYIESATLLGKHYTWKRPHLNEFLKYAFEHFDVAVWSSAMKENVSLLCEFIFTPEQRAKLLFEWDQTQCVRIEPHPNPTETKPLFEKRLTRVWNEFSEYTAKNTLIFDDSDLKMRNNPPGCTFLPSSWIVTQIHDHELSPNNGSIFTRLKMFSTK